MLGSGQIKPVGSNKTNDDERDDVWIVVFGLMRICILVIVRFQLSGMSDVLWQFARMLYLEVES